MRSLYSLISTGTELMKVGESKLSLVGKARARPDQVKKVLENVQQQGALTTYKKAMDRLDSYSPLGYSLAGVVQEVGRGAEEFAVGQLVACAGNEFALHAELNWVPTNLCVAVPDGVSPQLAAFATVGSIALQGVRQGNVQIGDTACVIGLGLVGQLVVQLLVASGVQVVGLDPDQDRCRLAEKAGALLCTAPDDDGAVAVEQALSEGVGRDRCRPGLSRLRAALRTSRSSWPPGWRGTGQRSSTSASASSICLGTTTTRRNSSFGSPARTGRAAMTPNTNSTESTTRPATCAGRSDAISTASSTPWPGRRSTRNRSSPGSSRSRTHRTSTSSSAPACCRASASSSSTTCRRELILRVRPPARPPRRGRLVGQISALQHQPRARSP